MTVNKSVCFLYFMTGVPLRAPLITSIEHQCEGIEVTWNQSSTDSGGGLVTGFHAQIKKINGDWRNCNIFLSDQSCLFKGLASETDYIIRVKAFNNKTTSDWTNEKTKTGFKGKWIRKLVTKKH